MKKVLAIVLAAMMVLSLFAGCAPSNGGNDGSDGVIKVGTSGPLTGSYAVYGVAVKNGLELAFEEINAKGGLQFELNAQDDEADAAIAENAYNNLYDWGMQIMAGPTTSGAALTIAGLCNEDGMFMLTPSASDPNVIKAGDSVFQICFSDTNQGIASADYIKGFMPDAVIGIIYDSSNPYSIGIYDNFVAQAEKNGLNVACVAAFDASNSANLNDQVTKCKEAGCDFVFLPIYAAEAAQVLTLADKMAYSPVFFGCDGLDGILNIEGFDPALAEGVMLLTPFDATASDERTQAFVKNYTEKYGIAPNQFAADAYDVAYAIYEACMAGGVTADMTHEEICAILVAQFTDPNFSYDGLTGAGMTWGADGAVSKMPMAVVIKNGVYVGVE